MRPETRRTAFALASRKTPDEPSPFVSSDREQIYVGDDNALTLEVSAENQGEGAYEAELHVYPPHQADFTGVVRSQVGVLVGLGGRGYW